MAGAFLLAVSRVNVVTPTGSYKDVTVTVRDGRAAIINRAGTEVAAMDASVVTPDGRRAQSVVGDDGTIWTVTKGGCGCGGGA